MSNQTHHPPHQSRSDVSWQKLSTTEKVGVLTVAATIAIGLVAAAATVSVPFIERSLDGDEGPNVVVGPSFTAPPWSPPPEEGTSPPGPGPTSVPPNVLSREAYTRAADELCEEAFREAGAIVESESDRLARFEQVLLVHNGLLIQWGKLEPPPGDEDDIDDILRAFDAGNSEAQRAATAFRSGDVSGYNAAESRGRQHEAEGSALARAYGFRVCSRLGG
jgi:hypothetical protein